MPHLCTENAEQQFGKSRTKGGCINHVTSCAYLFENRQWDTYKSKWPFSPSFFHTIKAVLMR